MTLSPSTGMTLPELAADHPVKHVVATILRKRRGPAPVRATTHAHWDARFFGLDRVTLFATAPSEVQAAILERCGRDLLGEAFYIEKAGVAFAAKMILLAETVDERKLYALFAADEATHLDGIACFYHPFRDEPAANPFLALLSELIETGCRQSLQAVIQVILEGWGLAHYRELRDGCSSAPLKAVLGAILADEAAHHGSGVVLVAERALADASATRIFETMRRFLALVQAGPLTLYAAVATARGPLAAAERRRLWTELDPQRSSAARLGQLEQLLSKTDSLAAVAARLAAAGCFEPRCLPEPA
ncbi:MAG: hypothetical protein JWN44_4322 [Myxococcales bacterium]|nr:hypothetical protein [Myxococcales bacterium]